MTGLRLLVLLGLLAGCARSEAPAVCAPAEARVVNASSSTVEQLYLGTAGDGWGADLLRGAELASRASLPIRFAGQGRQSLRVVWVNGQAAEMPDIDGCVIRRISIMDSGIRAE